MDLFKQNLLIIILLLLSNASVASDHVLQHNRWSLLSIPANSSELTVEQLFADDLPLSEYSSTWVIYTYDQQTQRYVEPTLNSAVDQGDGFWMIQITGADATIDLPANIPNGDSAQIETCAQDKKCFSKELATSEFSNNWAILGAPFLSPVDISDIRVSSANGPCVQGCDLEQAKSQGLLQGEQWIYNTTSGGYEQLFSANYLQPWQGFWIQSTNLPADTNLNVHLPNPDDSVEVTAQGLHTSYSELNDIRVRAQNGNTRYQDNINRVVAFANEGWPYGDVATEFNGTPYIESVYDKDCVRLNDLQTADILPNAGAHIYAMILAYILTGDDSYAANAKNIVLNFADSSGFDTVIDGSVQLNGSNQCAFEIGLFTPLLIETALLLETYPEWSSSDKAKVQSWLATEVYPVTAAIARTRKNNWATAAAFSSWAIGHYLIGSNLTLIEVHPAERSLTAAQAKNEHLQSQLKIVGNTWPGDTRCEKFGFQPHGGNPDELRRGSTGCDGTYLHEDDLALEYQIIIMGHLIYHAEALRRHSNNELFEYKLSNGESLILKGITFVIENPNGISHDWRKYALGTIRVANHTLNDSRLCEELEKSIYFKEARFIPFSKLTYPEVCR